MMRYDAESLHIRPTPHADPQLIVSVTPARAGWSLIHFEVRRLDAGQQHRFATGEHEMALVNLSGRYHVDSNRGTWTGLGGRATVWAGPAHALYLPRHTQGIISAEKAGELALTWVPSDEDHAPWLVTPEQVAVSVRGGDNVTRQINDLLPPGSPVQRLVLVEVYTPSGNWSSYPPHKHDRHLLADDGTLLEADLEEVYYYQFERPEGYAYQRVYTDDSSPLHAAGQPIDALIRPEMHSVVLVPEGYHPVTSAPGYTAYYLNVLAGSAQSLANQDDPRFSWVKTQYGPADPRVPLY